MFSRPKRNRKRISPALKEFRDDAIRIVGLCIAVYVIGQIVIAAWCNA